MVLGLTATPPEALTADQALLVDELFGAPLYRVSIPAVVKVGDLAPFVELAWLTTPTPSEDDWLAGGGGAVPGADHPADRPGVRVDAVPAVAGRAVRGQPVAVAQPGQGAAGRVPRRAPPAPRRHARAAAAAPGWPRSTARRRPPTTGCLLVDDWLSGHLTKTGRPEDEQVVEAVRRALPSVGYQWTKRGIRRGRSPVDRVLARSRVEDRRRSWPDRAPPSTATSPSGLRMLVLCDHERAGATLPADLTGVIDQQAGSAHAMLDALVAAPGDRPGSAPMLVTGKTVAGAPSTLPAFLALAARPRRWPRRCGSSRSDGSTDAEQPGRARGRAATGSGW